MNNFIVYSIEMAICLTLLYTVYWAFLRKETFFKLNRFYLLFSALVSLLLPLMNITTVNSSGENSFFTEYFTLPVDHYEQFIGKGTPGQFSGEEGPGFNKHGFKHHPLTTEANATAFQETSLQNASFSNVSDKKTDWLFIVFIIYLTGVAVLFVRFIRSLVLLFGYMIKHKHQKISNLKLVRLEKSTSPFSFFNFIFLGENDYPEAEINKIVAHEKVHIQQKHSLDLILFELLLIIQWFNPFMWMYKRAAKINHEYLADLGTLNSGVEISSYQYSLLNQMLRANNIDVASSYNFSVKQRIAMMMQKRSSRLSTLKVSFTLPILAFLFSAFAINCTTAESGNELSENITAMAMDSSIKKVDVSADYLKLIEGEYVSTNEPGRTRRIIFTELFGELIAYDAGYTYMPVFVGGGNFINPDDKATLFFDTKDQNNISLLLFGKINLKKVQAGKSTSKSLGYALAKVMFKEGVSNGMAFYKRVKDSSNYYLVEHEMNFGGYRLLANKKTKEAVALFKLNTELFPNSFNTFDSYADALLAMGDKTQAIEQYKKSLQLNPGSKNGIKQLKELGVDPQTVVKLPKLSAEELKMLEGIYLSANETNFIRKIVIRATEEGLTGEDNGYKYKLIAMGEGKFINPDDGVSIVFNTKDKNEISFVIFGRVTMKQVKTSKMPALSLKDYSGVYYPAGKDTLLRPMEIMHSNNKLFRFIETDPKGQNRTVELEFVAGNMFFYTDNSGRSVEFVVDDKKQVTGCILRRWDGTYNLTKGK